MEVIAAASAVIVKISVVSVLIAGVAELATVLVLGSILVEEILVAVTPVEAIRNISVPGKLPT
jgi:hypothetical protein